MANNNQRPWYRTPIIIIPAIAVIIAAIIGGIFILISSPQLPTGTIFKEIGGDTDTDGDYEISWESSKRAIKYILQEDRDSLFTSPRTIYTESETKKHIFGKSDGDYYYRVRACNEAGESEWSPIRKITVIISTPLAPTPKPTVTPTPTPTATSKLTPTTASSFSTSTKSTPTPVMTPTATAAPSPTPIPTPTPTSKPTPTTASSFSSSTKSTPTPIVTQTPTSTPTPTPTPTATPTPTPSPTRDNTSGWRTYRDNIGSSINIESIPGRTDNAIEITYDLEENGWVAISKRIDPEILSEEEAINFFYKGSGMPNTIELKLVYEDVGGTTFGALWNRATVTDDWVSRDVPYSRFDCWWPEDNCLRYGNNLNLTKVRKIEFAISNKPEDGDRYGSGIVIIDVQGINE